MARVLVVDDENLMRTMVEVACRRLGHEALCAATLAEGRRLAAAGVDVILLDMLLPDGNGLDAQQELAALPDAPDIVVITGHGDGDAADEAGGGAVLCAPESGAQAEETDGADTDTTECETEAYSEESTYDAEEFCGEGDPQGYEA